VPFSLSPAPTIHKILGWNDAVIFPEKIRENLAIIFDGLLKTISCYFMLEGSHLFFVLS